MNRKTSIIVVMIVAMTVVSATVFAWGPGKGTGCGPRWCQKFSDGLTGPCVDLTQEQRDQLQGLRQKFIDESAAIRATRAARFEEMNILMETSSPDRERLVQLSREIGDAMKQLMEKKIDFQLEAKKIAPELNLGRKGFGRSFERSNSMGMKGFQRQCARGNNNSNCPGLQGRGSGNCWQE